MEEQNSYLSPNSTPAVSLPQTGGRKLWLALAIVIVIVLIIGIIFWSIKGVDNRGTSTAPVLTEEQKTKIEQALEAPAPVVSKEQKAKVEEALKAPVPTLTAEQKAKIEKALGQ